LLVCWCGASQLTRGRVCSWQLLLGLASAAFVWFQSPGTHGHVLLSQTGLPKPGRRNMRIIVKAKVYVTIDGRRLVCVGIRQPPGVHDEISYYGQTIANLLSGAPSLTRGRRKFTIVCLWCSPTHSFSGPSSAGLMTIFFCLRFETLPTCRASSPYLYPSRVGWPSYTPQRRVTFSSPLNNSLGYSDGTWTDSIRSCSVSSAATSQSYITTDDKSASLCWCQAPTHLRAHGLIFITFRQLHVFYVGHLLWREDGHAVYNCCWASPAQLFLGPSHAELENYILLSEIQESLNLEGQVPIFISSGTWWPSYLS
jgi:hypothetical protein